MSGGSDAGRAREHGRRGFTDNSRGSLRGCVPVDEGRPVASSHVRIRDSAFAVIVRRSRVLLVRARRERRWQLPGGRMKRTETPVEAALREVEEETGMRPRILGVTGAYSRSDGSVAVVHAASVAPTAEPCGPRHEIREQRWVPRAEALRMLPLKTRRRLSEALDARVGSAQRRRARAAPRPR
jgi:8-oxo-dGTP diphosphatase